MTPPLPAIRALGTRALEELARTLRAGHLPAGTSSFQIQRIVPGADARAAEELVTLLASGLSPGHAALLLEAIVAERGSGRLEPIELVTSGPDVTGTTRDTGVVMRELFTRAEERVLVVGFAVHQGPWVFRALAERMDQRPALHVRLCLDVPRRPGDTSKASGILERFAIRFRKQEWPGARLPEVFHDPRALAEDARARASLHAKCVVVDGRTALLGSANLTEAAQERNIEVGVLLRAPGMAQALEAHFSALIRSGLLRPLTSP